MAFVVLLLEAAAVAGLLYYLIQLTMRRNRLAADISWARGPSSLPLLGNIVDFINLDQEGRYNVLTKFHRQFGSVYKIWIGPDPIIATSDPQMLQELSKRGRTAKKSIEYKYLNAFIGDGVLTTAGDEWYRKRKLLNPCFHYDIVATFLDAINSHSRKLVQHLSHLAENREPFDFLDKAKLATLDLLTDTMMGLNVNAIENENNEYVKAIAKMREIINLRSMSSFLRFDAIYNFSSLKAEEVKVVKILRSFVKEVIIGRRRMRKSSEKGNSPEKESNKKPLLEMLLDLNDSGAQISEEEIENEINTFMFAGHDTTSVALSYALYLMGRHPEIQERVVKELTEKFPNFPEEGLSHLDLNKLEYTDMCIKESLRMFPPVPLIGKILQTPLQTEKGLIPEGVNTMENLYQLQNDSNNYPEPHVFNPDRFLPENSASRASHTYIPFGIGPRICIGQKFALAEVKVIFCYLLKSYRIESLDEPEDLRLSFDVVLTPVSGIKLKISKR